MKYKCFDCNRVVSDEYVKKRIHCPYCGSKILFKRRLIATKLKAI